MKPKSSNTFRGVISSILMVCFCLLLISSFNKASIKKTDVPISDVITRANDENGNIEKITVIGNRLDITLKGQSEPSETSRKDASGTLYEQGLINHCVNLKGDAFTACEKK